MTQKGRKQFPVIKEGPHESSGAWASVLHGPREHNMCAPRLAAADGAPDFWKVLGEMFPRTRNQRCWVHKVCNILCHLPWSLRWCPRAELCETWQAATQVAAHAFICKRRDKYPKATNCLERDLGDLPAFCGCPDTHGQSLRTTNPIQPALATVRHRTWQRRDCVSRRTAMDLVHKLACAARVWWRLLAGLDKIPGVLGFVPCTDGKAISHKDKTCATA